jgi:hypothetical protein
MMTLQDIHDLQKAYVTELKNVFPIPLETSQAWKIVRGLWPTITELPEDDGYRCFEVRMSPLANLLGAITCGDHNVGFHTGTGVLQTLTLVGMCSAVTSHFRPGYALRKIAPEIAFVRTVPIGATVILQAKELKARGPLSLFELRGQIEETGEELFEPSRVLTMFKISSQT